MNEKEASLHLATLADFVPYYEQINERMKKTIGEARYNDLYSKCKYGYMGASDYYDIYGVPLLFLPLHRMGDSYSLCMGDTLKKIYGYLGRTLKEKYSKQKHLIWDLYSDNGGYTYYEDICTAKSSFFYYSEEDLLSEFSYWDSIAHKKVSGLYADFWANKLVSVNEVLRVLLRFMKDSLSENRKICVIDSEEKRKFVGLIDWDFFVLDKAGNVYQYDDVSISFDHEEYQGEVLVPNRVKQYYRSYNVKCGDDTHRVGYRYWVYNNGKKEINTVFSSVYVYDIV